MRKPDRQLGKYRNRQQRIGKRALEILENKFPGGFAFRRQEGVGDTGVDCELEPFEQTEPFGGLERASGFIFKGQIKGVEDASGLELKTKPVLSKEFDIDDLYYWFEQLSLPLVIFLVDVSTEKIYWTEYYSDPNLRRTYQTAKAAGNLSVNIHFKKSKTVPETVSDLLKAVQRASGRLALSSFPDLGTLEAHLREQPDIEEEIRSVEYRRELAYFEHFVRLVDNSKWEMAENIKDKILRDESFSDRLKLQAIFTAARIVYNVQIPRIEPDDFLSYDFKWRVSEIHQHIRVDESDDPVVGIVSSLMKSVSVIRSASFALAQSTIASLHFSENHENFIAQFAIPINHAREALLFDIIRQNVQEYNATVREINDISVFVDAVGVMAPLLAQALLPFRYALSLRKETDTLDGINEQLFDSLKFHAEVAAEVSNKFLMSQCLFGIVTLRLLPSESLRFYDEARTIVSNLEDSEFRQEMKIELEQLIQHSTPMTFGQEDSKSEMQMRRTMAMRLAEQLGYDLAKDSSAVDYSDDFDRRIHDLLQNGLDELDLTEYLRDCRHRHIYKPEFVGVSEVADAVGLGFACSMKGITCLEKQVFSNSAGRKVENTYAIFHETHCVDCELIESHDLSWHYSYKWQSTQQERFQEMMEQIEKTQDDSGVD